jgi:two-component system, OmpR family, phosphate regulon sensor histidine kinase PhoR
VKKVSIKRLRFLVACCLVGINAFQGYWLWRQYKDSQRNFTITVQGALVQATQQIQWAGITRMLPEMRRKEYPSGTNIKSININFRTANHSLTDKVMMVPTGSAPLSAIDSLFNIELQKRGIWEKYTLDTFNRKSNVKAPPDFSSRDTVIKSNSMSGAGTKSQDTVIKGISIRGSENRMLFIDVREFEAQNSENIEATAPLNLERNTFVRASFPRNNYHILVGIAGALVASLLLALLTAGAFFYLLYIIQQQKKLAALKDDFISAMTHELQTPIATASAAVEALQHFKALDNPERTKEYLQITQNQLIQLSGMVDQTLRLAAEERNEFQISPRLTDLNDLVPPMLQRIELAAGRPVQLHFDNQLSGPVSADPNYLSQALQNLVDNAIKYCPDDRIPNIRITAASTDTGYAITVQDNSSGIPAEYQDKLFNRFFRAPSTSNVKGFGLGLYVVQRIAEGHGGKAWLKESSEAGSVFIFLLNR